MLHIIMDNYVIGLMLVIAIDMVAILWIKMWIVVAVIILVDVF
jgi:hypothetical protein